MNHSELKTWALEVLTKVRNSPRWTGIREDVDDALLRTQEIITEVVIKVGTSIETLEDWKELGPLMRYAMSIQMDRFRGTDLSTWDTLTALSEKGFTVISFSRSGHPTVHSWKENISPDERCRWKTDSERFKGVDMTDLTILLTL